MKVLIVDDEIIALNSLKKRMDWLKYGYTDVLTAENITDARKYLESGTVDLVLCDIEMPGENGLDLIAYIKEHFSDIPCIMVTCHEEFPYVQQALRYGVKDYLLKPVGEEELYGLLTKIAEEKMDKEELQQVNQLTQKRKDQTKELSEKSGDSPQERIQMVQQYIEAHIQETITVSDIASHVFINAQYLMRIFKKETGMSITEYITARRISLAGRLLRDSDYTVNFISDCVGFESCSYFIRVFKKQTGFSPGEYRVQFSKKE